MYLSEEQIIKVIIEYVMDKRYTQAILIEGEWGSGKTFFVKGKLFTELKDHIGTKTEYKQSIIYTSLYGIENLQQVMKEIYASLMESFLDDKIGQGKGEAIGKGINFMSKLVSAGLGHFNIDKEDLPNITELKKLKNAVLIFDDLERCNISVNQIFGFINNLVEHNDIKVIIVANQDEIGNMKLTEDLAQKYAIVLNKNLCLQTGNDKKEGNNGSQEQNQDKPISKDELIKYTEKLFSNDILYKKIKEKLIGVTIHYHSDFRNVYKSVLKEYIKDNDVNKYLFTKRNLVLNIFESKEHYNIRTLIFAIMAFEKIDILIKEIKFEQKYIDEQRENILKYCMTLAIHLKLGKKPYSWKDGTVKSGNISIDDDYLFGEHIFGYKFVDDYLLYRSFNCEEIKNLLIHIMEDRKEEDQYKKFQNSLSYNSLVAWWELEDDEIRDKLTYILKELEEKNIILYTLKV
ncbi:P-loop NTPase fold protein [Clostridium sp. AWRP]|uniref:P-loop NTPase fold protein n=1 Tax=Clostridium sp. AWRP TaxID=2212991 RepID=UPI000FDB133B|nr:P-loop NTPase fold protein [Clostridium sp. AWRP]AZV58365.1 hypothetical protein DMR38_18215 [Clostridium sp. AWRP]